LLRRDLLGTGLDRVKGGFRGLLFNAGEGLIGSLFGLAKMLTLRAVLHIVLGATRLANPEASFRSNKKAPLCGAFYLMAEREGFEPSIRFLLFTLSRGAP
jgi:hypothetical protein